MSNELIVVTGATGNVGKKLVEILLSRGKKVRAVARNENNLKSLASKGAEIISANLNNPGEVKNCFNGAKVVFTLIPSNYGSNDFRGDQNRVSECYTSAIKECGIKSIVNLSSLGAHIDGNIGPIKGLQDHEKRLNEIKDVNILHLRPAYFMENILLNIDLIRQNKINGTALKNDLAIPMIATKDIAEKAAEVLSDLKFSGKSALEILGPKELTLDEVTLALGNAIGLNDLKYIQFSYKDVEKSLIEFGMSQDAAALLIELDKGLNDGLIKPAEARSTINTTPTSIEEFAKMFAEIYKN